MKTVLLILANALCGLGLLSAVCWGTGNEQLSCVRAACVVVVFAAMVCGGLFVVVAGSKS